LAFVLPCSSNKESPKECTTVFSPDWALIKDQTKRNQGDPTSTCFFVEIFPDQDCFRLFQFLEKERDLSGTQNSSDLRLCHKFPLDPFKERLGRGTFLMKPILPILPRQPKNCTPSVESLSTYLSKFNLNSGIRCRELQLRPQLCTSKRPLK
jgi:hypothetical protein